MKIKTKLTLGIGLLFALIILLIAVAGRYIHLLRNDTNNVIVANYNSLDYAKNMLAALDETPAKGILDLETNLRLQEKNITETGERTATQQLRAYFLQYQADSVRQKYAPLIRASIYQVMALNIEAIARKNTLTQQRADDAYSLIAIVGTLCFVIAFTLLVNLPSSIANPIEELTESIRQIAAKNYSQRVGFLSHNEFGDLARSFNSMAEKLEEYNSSTLATLMIEKKRVETLINNMHDPVLGLDEHQKIIFVNEEAAKIIGLKAADLISKSAKDVAIHNDLVRSLLQDLGNISATISKPIKIYANGKESYFEREILPISVVPTGEQISIFIGHVLILRNITQYKELDTAKTNFIATVSHEFKTPIASIKMSLQLLEDERVGVLNDEQKRLKESIKEDTNRLLNITGELLNITQVESGNIQLLMQATNPNVLMQDAMEANHTQAQQKGVKLEWTPLDAPRDVWADAEKTVWVLTNLISNAIRYSYDNASVLLKVEQQNEQLIFSVQDTGQGIAPQYQSKVFDRYFRVPGTKKEGTGLGLAISKEFIEAQGGRINVESDFGAGSRFAVALKTVQPQFSSLKNTRFTRALMPVRSS